MIGNDILLDGFTRVYESLHRTLADLTEAADMSNTAVNTTSTLVTADEAGITVCNLDEGGWALIEGREPEFIELQPRTIEAQFTMTDLVSAAPVAERRTRPKVEPAKAPAAAAEQRSFF